MAYNSINIKPFRTTKGNNSNRAPSPYFFVLSICLAYMNMFARFDENPAMTFQDIKKTKRYGRTDARTQGQRENSIPTTNKLCRGITMFIAFKQNKHENITFKHNTQLKYRYIMHHPRSLFRLISTSDLSGPP